MKSSAQALLRLQELGSSALRGKQGLLSHSRFMSVRRPAVIEALLAAAYFGLRRQDDNHRLSSSNNVAPKMQGPNSLHALASRSPPSAVLPNPSLKPRLNSNVRLHKARMSQVLLLEYQDTWPEQFLGVAEELRAVVAVPSAVIEHIGSTSVQGLCAKPVLDILLGVTSLAEVEAAVPALAAAGFVYRPEYEREIPDRRYFTRPPGNSPRIHLHAVVRNGLLWRQHLHFRDRLRQDSQLRESYATLKRQLAVAHTADKAAYTEAKAPFIRRVLSSGLTHSTSALRSAA